MSQWTNKQNIEKSNLDKEWVELLLTAKKEGLTVEEIRRFLARNHSQMHRFIKEGKNIKEVRRNLRTL